MAVQSQVDAATSTISHCDMADAHALREIADTLRTLAEKASKADSPAVRALLVLTAKSIRDIALQTEREALPLARTTAEMMRRLGGTGES